VALGGALSRRRHRRQCRRGRAASGALGELPEHDAAQRALFRRGLRDVWLAQRARRIDGARDGRRVESWFSPLAISNEKPALLAMQFAAQSAHSAGVSAD
jgi:hypothetical protein